MKTTRDVVAEVMAKAAGEEPEDPAGTAQDEGGAVDEPEAQAEPADAAEAASDDGQGAADEEPKGDRPRGKDGKFAPADKAKAEKPAEGVNKALPEKPLMAEAEGPALKPPADWTPRAKEKWAGLPREVQEESIRLHLETKKTLQESAQARQEAQVWREGLAPYEHMFRANGQTAQQGVGMLVQTYAALRTAPMPQRAAIVAGLVRDFIGVDEASINLLAAALEGKPGGAAPAGSAALRPDQIQQMVREEAQRMQGEGQRQTTLKTIQDFEAGAPEFLKTVENDVALIVNLEQAKGVPITKELLQKAYDKAVLLHPETAAILKQRDDAAKAKENAAAAAKKKAAASGIRNEPGGPAGPAKARSTRDEVARQFDSASSGKHV